MLFLACEGCLHTLWVCDVTLQHRQTLVLRAQYSQGSKTVPACVADALGAGAGCASAALCAVFTLSRSGHVTAPVGRPWCLLANQDILHHCSAEKTFQAALRAVQACVDRVCLMGPACSRVRWRISLSGLPQVTSGSKPAYFEGSLTTALTSWLVAKRRFTHSRPVAPPAPKTVVTAIVDSYN